jgi:GH24 family phage-related lysozyme (muramidase)
MSRARIAVAALSLSAAAMVAIWGEEGWTESTVIPVKGDVPTVGPGLTKRPDGSPVRMGDTIKPLEGARRSLAHLQQGEAALRRCITAPMHQAEWDIVNDFAYQYGTAAACRSSIVREANAGNYAASCEAYLKFRFVAGYDCSTPGNTRCRGVWLRSKARRDACMAVQ